ncbi:protein turtle isoform X2 [Contarinia nasturtii]|uniref:protein turtle isoform X2 n=1 Tax=Contarinia nasturtii TaxID=265458 RepID=UPI0012D42F85|nr:protein turtle isoform X2 [Contarinia nasturtii]
MGLCSDHWSLWWCKALSRSRSFATTLNNYLLTILVVLTTISYSNANSLPGQQDAIHITAILGESVIFNCHVEFPGDHPVPYVLQWEKKGQEIPIYIWYENYPTHSGEGYEGRVSRVSSDSPFGAASLNLTNIRESDQGWYECKVVFLNRSPNQHKNGSWFHLDVHAPPRFSVTPEDIVYVNLGDSIILNCQAEGTPTPEILWYKDANPVDPSSTVGIFNDGTELRISTIRHEDIGDYTCIARNGEGQVSHTARVIIAGGAVIMVPPTNQTKLEGEKAIFTCEAKAMPGNVTVRWFREGSPVREVASLETRVTIRKDGSLIINPVSADDSGQYLCEVSNGIGDPQSASAYLNVEYPAKVTFTPTVQYLPFRLAGVVQCYIKANPPLQYVTWTKDKRLLEPYQTKDIVIMNNGSLLFTRVNQNHQGRYTCTPYNAQGTQGSSGAMEVLVRKPPVFTIEPDLLYQRKVGESVEMSCDAQEAEGTQRPNIQWLRRDGMPLQRNRVKSSGGNITIENLRRSDFGFYQCVVSNEVATIVSGTQLVIEGTQPHAPYNVSGIATENSITITWMPGYSGGPDYKQDYTLWYREAGVSDWSTIQVSPSGSTSVTINGLTPSKTYEFQVVGKNALGDGMMSKLITIRTIETPSSKPKQAPSPTHTPPLVSAWSTASPGMGLIPPLTPTIAGPKPGQPRNVTVTEVSNGFLISWQEPLERTSLIQHYTIRYRTDAQWKTLNRGQIRPIDTSYLVKSLVGGRTYYFRVLAHSQGSYESSDEVKFPVPARVKHKAITAGVVGGILFFIVAIILSICAVKICNQRKRRKQEKAYNMVACRITDARNSHCRTGSASSSHVPLNKYRRSRIPGLKTLATIVRWIWPRDRCTNCQSIYSITRPSDMITKNIDQIHRSTDGRFVITYGSDLEISRPTSATGSNSSESDDGGFLPRQSQQQLNNKTNNKNKLRTSWRRPLVSYPSEMSFGPVTPTPRRASHDGLLRIGTNEQPLLQIVPVELHPIPPTYQNINSLDRNSMRHTLPYPHTPSRVSRIVSSSPAVSSPIAHSSTILSPQSMYFSDLSSVLQNSSRDRTPRTPQSSNISQLRLLQERYAQELPSLRAIHEETQRMAAQYPMHEQMLHTPSQYLPNSYYHPHLHHINYDQSPSSPSLVQHHHHHHHYQSQQQPLVHQRQKSRLLPRHIRMARSAPELGLPTVNYIDTTMEASPESQSSSSGFGSRNTSHALHNHSSRSGSQPSVRNLPPYRPPPQPFYYYYPYDASSTSQHSSPYTMDHWVDLIKQMSGDNYLTRTNENQMASDAKAVDVGSVDGHYEFDPATPTPTASTPTGATRDDLLLSTLPNSQFTLLQTTQSLQPYQRKRVSKYENMEARVQAMKEEFYAYRKRQAMQMQQHHSASTNANKNSSIELESAC